MKENITAFEGTLHKLTVNVSGVEDFSDYLVYGVAQPYGCSKCAHFEIVSKTEGTCEMIIPALRCGIYKYQLFIKRISTNQEFLILEGEINVKDRLCDCSATTSNDETSTIVDATFSADTVEVNVSIQEGAEGKPGPQGPQGEPGQGGGGAIDAQESKKRALEEFYGVPLSASKYWVAFNSLGGVTALSDNLVPTNLANCDIEALDYNGLNITNPNMYLGKSFINFNLECNSTTNDPEDNTKSIGVAYFQYMPNLEKFHQTGVVEENTIDLSKIEIPYLSIDKVGEIKLRDDRSLKKIKVISEPGQLKKASSICENCESLEEIDIDLSEVRSLTYGFKNCYKLKNFTISNPYITDLNEAFMNCKSLESVNIDCPEVKIASKTFNGCKSLVKLPNLNYANITNAYNMFSDCESLTSAPEVLGGDGISQAFSGCKALEEINITLPDATYNANNFLMGCDSLKSAKITAPKLTNLNQFFSSCHNLEDVSLSTSDISSVYYSFASCKKLKNAPQINFSDTGVNGQYAFYGCESLESCDWDTTYFTNMNNMFSECKKFHTFSGSLASATGVSNMFYYCILNADTVKHIFNSIKTENNYSSSLSFNSFGVSPLIYTDDEIISLLGVTDSSNLNSLSFVTTNAKGVNVTGTITTNWYEPIFEEDLSSLQFGRKLFNDNDYIEEFKADIPQVTSGYYMFYSCSKLTLFEGDTSALTDGQAMFYACPKLTEVKANFENLEKGKDMFNGCTSLTEWDKPLNKLSDGEQMFQNTSLSRWDIDLPALTNGTRMFSESKLKSFEGDLSALTSARYMFQNTGLETFNSGLPNIGSCLGIFEGCKLDADSVRNILTSFKNKYVSDEFRMGIKRSAVPTFKEITGKEPTSTTSYVSMGSYQGKRLYVKITSED